MCKSKNNKEERRSLVLILMTKYLNKNAFWNHLIFKRVHLATDNGSLKREVKGAREIAQH